MKPENDTSNLQIALLLGMISFGSLLFALIAGIAGFLIFRALYLYEFGTNSLTHYL